MERIMSRRQGEVLVILLSDGSEVQITFQEIHTDGRIRLRIEDLPPGVEIARGEVIKHRMDNIARLEIGEG